MQSLSMGLVPNSCAWAKIRRKFRKMMYQLFLFCQHVFIQVNGMFMESINVNIVGFFYNYLSSGCLFFVSSILY